LRQLEQDTGKKPKALQDMPVVLPHQGMFLDVFQTLCEWRGYTGMGDMAPISLADMLSYFSIYKVDAVELRDAIVTQVKRLDRVFLENAAKAKAEATPKTES
jgi:hypothetical protein